MRIACVMAGGRGDMDLLLHGFAMRAAARGLRLCGTVQVNSDCGAGRPCDMDVQVLPDPEEASPMLHWTLGGPWFREQRTMGGPLAAEWFSGLPGRKTGSVGEAAMSDWTIRGGSIYLGFRAERRFDMGER